MNDPNVVVMVIGSIFLLLGLGFVFDFKGFSVKRDAQNKSKVVAGLLSMVGIALILLGLYGLSNIGTPPPPPPPPDDPSVAFTSPEDGAQVGREVTMRGTWKNVPADQLIWIVGLGGDNLFYPQDGPVGRQANGEWQSPIIYVVGEDESTSVGSSFNYKVIVIPASAADQFRQLRSGYDGTSELPPGTVVHDSITVTRT